RRLRVRDDDRVEWNRSIPHLPRGGDGHESARLGRGCRQPPCASFALHRRTLLANSGRHRARPVDISLGNVWAATRRNTWRLAMGPLVWLILLVIPGLITLHLGTMNRLSAAVVLTLLDLISIIAGVIGVSFLSLAYKHFFPTKPRFRFRAGMLVPIPASKLAAARSVIPVAASPSAPAATLHRRDERSNSAIVCRLGRRLRC